MFINIKQSLARLSEIVLKLTVKAYNIFSLFSHVNTHVIKWQVLTKFYYLQLLVYYAACMKINYPSHHKWNKPLADDPFYSFGKSNTARLKSTLNKIDNLDIKHEIAPLTEETLSWFTPLYNKTISNKNNPKVFDIYATTLGKNSKFPYFSLSLYENGSPIGATIFSERKNILSIAYRIYPNKWNDHKLQASPSIYTEYLLTKYGIEKGFTKLSHGRDRNPYGPNAHIGLAIYKLSVGCSVFTPSVSYEINTMELDDITTDTLVFEQPKEGERITKGYLCVSKDTKDKYEQVTKYPEQIEIETIVR